MDIAKQIWSALNEPWVAATLSILSILVITITIAEKFLRLTSAIARWKGWSAVPRCYSSLQKKHRIRRTKDIMLDALENKYGRVTLGIQPYNSCLNENQTSSSRSTLGAITPEKPAWLNDYYVATALESLAEDCRIVKATKFHLNSWPPTAELFQFSKRIDGVSCEQQIDESEAESKCLAHQFWNECLKPSRYVPKERAETIEPGTTQIGTEYWLKDDAPPCSRCWDIKSRQSDIRSLVESITKYDLSPATTVDITGRNQEFQEAIISVCIGSQCEAKAATIRKIVEQAIEIRSAQICALQPDNRTEWPEPLTLEFKSRLETYV